MFMLNCTQCNFLSIENQPMFEGRNLCLAKVGGNPHMGAAGHGAFAGTLSQLQNSQAGLLLQL